MEIVNTQYPIAFDIQEGKKPVTKKNTRNLFKNLFMKMIDERQQQLKNDNKLDNWAEW